MCIRMVCALDPVLLAKYLGIDINKWADNINYNIHPGSDVTVIKFDEKGGKCLRTMKWGLITSVGKDKKLDHFKLFNARSETLDSTYSFKNLVHNKRCVVAIQGFYEWKNQSIDKNPFYIKSEKSDLIYLAGLYTSIKTEEKDDDNEMLYTFTICTGKSPSKFSKIHPRIPIILKNEEEINEWINPSNTDYKKCLVPNEDNLSWYQVSSKINSNLDINEPSNIEKINVTSLNSFFTPMKKEEIKEEEKFEKEDDVKEENVKEEKEEEEKELKKKRTSNENNNDNNNKKISNYFKKIKTK